MSVESLSKLSAASAAYTKTVEASLAKMEKEFSCELSASFKMGILVHSREAFTEGYIAGVRDTEKSPNDNRPG